jgi:hypothetical protein
MVMVVVVSASRPEQLSIFGRPGPILDNRELLEIGALC